MAETAEPPAEIVGVPDTYPPGDGPLTADKAQALIAKEVG